MAKKIELTTSGSEPLTQTLPLANEAGEPLTVDELRVVAAALLADDGKAFSLRYMDSDGDEVTIAHNADVKELADYMADEQLELVTVLVSPQGRLFANAAQTQLRGLVSAMSTLTTVKPKQPTPANAMNLMVASLKTMDVADDSEELAAVKKQLLAVLEDEEFKKAVEELSVSEEFKELANVMATAISEEDAWAIEETTTARFDELLVFAQRLVARCPTLKPVMINVAKNCMSGLIRHNDEELENDGSDSSSSSSSSEESLDVEVQEVAVHFGVICDGCEKEPLIGVRYKSLEVPDFDLCEDCEASGKWLSHEPFIKITDPSRAPKHKRSELLVHPFVVCDGCEMRPIVGPRFKSKTADNFDLCEACEATGNWNKSHGPFTKIQEPGMMHAMKFTCRRGGKFGHHGKFGRHHGKFGHHGHHGLPGILFGPPPIYYGPDVCGPRPHHGRPSFPGHGPPPPPPHHGGPADFGERGRPDFRGDGFPPPPPEFGECGRPDSHGHGFPPPPPPEFGHHPRHHGPPGFGPRCFGRFGPPPFDFPGPHGAPPSPPDFPVVFGPRGSRGFRGYRGRHGPSMRSPDDEKDQQQERDCPRRRYGCRGRGRWSRDASDLEARFLEDVTIEDGTVVEAGKQVRKMWKLVNDGEHAWPDGCYMITQSGNPMFPEGTESSRIDLPPLASGEEFIAGVDLVAPTEPGRYSSFWRMCDPAGVSFGHRFWIAIVVAGDAAPEPTPSEAPTADSAEDSDMKDSAEVASPADASSDDDIEIIEASEAQEAEANDEAAENVEEDADDKDKELFMESLNLLAAMGFTDSDKNLRALQLAEGNVGGAVNALLSE